jgi:predicted dehydrogenase
MTVRWGLVGTASWARRTHGAALRAQPGVELVGIWGRDPERTAEAAGELTTRPYGSLDALLTDVDAVTMAVPPAVQTEFAVTAARAGRHLLLEKPLALSSDGARRVVDAVTAANVASVVFLTSRFCTEQRDWLRDITLMGGWRSVAATWYASLYQPEESHPGDWRSDYGALWDVGPHALSVVLPFLSDAETVTATAGIGDTVHLLLRHAIGATSTISLSLTMPKEAAGSSVVAHGLPGVTTMPAGKTTSVEAAGVAVAELVANIQAGTTQHECDVRLGRHIVDILAAAQESIRTGRTVTLSTED